MSITFSIEGIHEEDGTDLPCPDCGLSLATAHLHPQRNFDCSCGGYGGPEELPEPQFQLNLSNGNGMALLRFLELGSDPYGAAEADHVLFQLAIKGASSGLLTAPAVSEQLVRITSDGVGMGPMVHTGGRTTEQVERYLSTLGRIAAKASSYGRKVVWG